MPERLIIDGLEMEAMLNGPDGMVMHELIRRADKVIVRGRQLLEPHRRGGRLQGSIVKRIGVVSSTGPTIRVVAGAGLGDPNYAVWVHEGNGPEGGRIYPKHGSHLVFDLGGQTIFAKSVKTSTPVPFLREALPAARA